MGKETVYTSDLDVDTEFELKVFALEEGNIRIFIGDPSDDYAAAWMDFSKESAIEFMEDFNTLIKDL
jgi:hypothetical protein